MKLDGRAGRSRAALLLMVLVALVAGGYAAVAAAASGPSANASSDNEGICDWQGEIVLVGFNFAQVGTVAADGQLLHIDKHVHLFEIFGTTFGGNGTTTFGVPDLRGKAPIAGLHYVVCSTGPFPAESTQTSHCNWLGQIILTAAPLPFRGTVSANGQLLETSNYQALFALYGHTFGGSQTSGKFGVPSIENRVPIPGLHYRVCTSGSFPQPDGGTGRCNWLGQVVLFPFTPVPFATLAAHGQLLKLSTHTALFSLFNFTFGGSLNSGEFGVPNLAGKAPPNLHYAACTRGAYPVRE